MSQLSQPLPASLTRLLLGRRTPLLAWLLRVVPRAARPEGLPPGLQRDVGVSLPPPDHRGAHWYL